MSNWFALDGNSEISDRWGCIWVSKYGCWFNWGSPISKTANLVIGWNKVMKKWMPYRSTQIAQLLNYLCPCSFRKFVGKPFHLDEVEIFFLYIRIKIFDFKKSHSSLWLTTLLNTFLLSKGTIYINQRCVDCLLKT